jgi:cobalt-zinc-cadmium efflux system outer membrane protein
MNKQSPLVALLATAVLSSCTSQKASAPMAKAAVDASIVKTNTQPPDLLVELKEPEELTLPQALALTLEKSPELTSFSSAVRGGEARILQAGLIPNPELSLQVEDAFGPYGGRSYSQATLQLSQVIELGGKRSARVDSATAFHNQLKHEYEIKRVEVLSSLTDKFIRTTADQQLFKLAENGVGLAKQALQSIQRRTEAGAISELEEIKAKVFLARSRIASEHAEHELLSSQRELAAYWGADTPTFSRISSDLFQKPTLPPFEALASRIDQSPEIKKWATEKRLREAEKKLADTKAVPNLTLGAGPRRLEVTNDESWVFQFSVPLTVFDRNQGARKEAEILNDKADIDKNSAQIRLKTTLFALYQEAKHAGVQLETMQQEVIPQAERYLKTAQSGYEQGRFSYLDLVDAQQTLLEVSREGIEAAYSYHSFINSIERLLGSALSTENTKLN